ncbi:hypothetical protein [Streptomyces sp. H27-C3]|uniref:hypothetical protein n=1 Tax=Streptomyces sp. H27-C3 TaxID=3046305 RepID=UPI0024BA4315|nr:hypothetical protein [Streptomyces sp. H27-C3]MDJ0464998.1 hypothetical protein [Streptomyces sp. H27-C3]
MSEAPQYPEVAVQLSGEDGNVYSVIGRVQGALRKAGHRDAATEFSQAARAAQSYDEVLQLAMRTVDVS